MKTGAALVVKFLMTLAATAIAFRLFAANPWYWIFVIALVGTALNYLLGDVVILPNWGNIPAVIMDGLMAVLTAYVVSYVAADFSINILSALVLFGLVAVAEYFFHMFLERSEEVAP